MIKYTIILPCFNVAGFLGKCLSSIFRNNTTELEIVIIDDGSTDDFKGSVEDFFDIKINGKTTLFKHRSASVKVVRQENSGVSAARNRGLKLATGKYILFMDPDDYISDDMFEKIERIIFENPEFDMLIMGFNRVWEDESGKCIKIEKRLPHKQYDVNSNKQAIDEILPKYLGYSVENMSIWGAGGTYLPLQLEFGAVWRNVYNRDFLLENEIYFNEKIKLNEDSMFNANCIARADKIVSSDECLYYYTVRISGAFMKNRGLTLVTNKLHLLEERYKIVQYLAECGFEKSIWDFAGSNVMSVFELMVKCSFYDRKEVNKYIKNPLVRESIRLMPRIGIKKVDIPVFILKLGLSGFLHLSVNLAKKVGVKFTV